MGGALQQGRWEDLQQGYALTGVADYRLGDVTFLAEGLFLSGFNQRGSTNTALGRRFDYNQPSTLERLDQLLEFSYDPPSDGTSDG